MAIQRRAARREKRLAITSATCPVAMAVSIAGRPSVPRPPPIVKKRAIALCGIRWLATATAPSRLIVTASGKIRLASSETGASTLRPESLGSVAFSPGIGVQTVGISLDGSGDIDMRDAGGVADVGSVIVAFLSRLATARTDLALTVHQRLLVVCPK